MQTENTSDEVCQPHVVSVRSLVEFVLSAGDITPGGFQRRDRAQLGTQGHKRVQRSRPEGYETEVEIAYRVDGSDLPLEVRGRIDGLYANEVPVIIEEIKTTTQSLELIGEEHNRLHWAQAQCYAYMLARQNHLSAVRIHLTYYHLDSRVEKTFERHFTIFRIGNLFPRPDQALSGVVSKDLGVADPARPIDSTAGFPLCGLPPRPARDGRGSLQSYPGQ